MVAVPSLSVHEYLAWYNSCLHCGHGAYAHAAVLKKFMKIHSILIPFFHKLGEPPHIYIYIYK